MSTEATAWGYCSNCRNGIRPGDFITEHDGGWWIHEDCSDNEREAGWSASSWLPMIGLAGQLGDLQSVRTLTKHALYADHCGGWEVHAWPCPEATKALELIKAAIP